MKWAGLRLRWGLTRVWVRQRSCSRRNLVVADHVLAELGPVLSVVFGSSGHGYEGDVEVVGSASHHPAVVAGPAGHHAALALDVFDGLGHEEGQSHTVACGGGDVGHLVQGVGVVLHVVEGGYGEGPVAEAGVGGHIGDALPTDADVAGTFPEAVDVFSASACWHGVPPLTT